jgi:ketosteroid isomerase-like protein
VRIVGRPMIVVVLSATAAMLLLSVRVLVFSAVANPAEGSGTDRTADREAIRADIDRIYRAYIGKDIEKVRATHAPGWIGFLEGSREIIRGIDDYMRRVEPGLRSPYGMTAYRIRDFDIAFSGDAAFVTFITDVDIKTPSGPIHSVQRLADFYVKQNGKWVQSGSNTSTSPETIADQLSRPQQLSADERKRLLDAREAVWRAFFANDRPTLEKLLPAELVTLTPAGDGFGTRESVMGQSAAIAQKGVKLTRLEFPATEIQCYGNTAFIYSTYAYELEENGNGIPRSGSVTEIFVMRSGEWVNAGWHMD